MTKKHRAHDDAAWKNARKICRLTARQVEMARTLGMNPRKLPGLRPSPHQRGKLPVGEFIEECYRKRFGVPRDRHPGERRPPRATTNLDPGASNPVSDPRYQLSDLVCYLVNLAEDLQQWLAYGSIDPRVTAQLRDELRAIAEALDTGAPIPPFSAIPAPPRPANRRSSRQGGRIAMLDDEIPF
jgi:hypothetical protein